MADWFKDIQGLFGHAAVRAGHAKQLKSTFSKVENELIRSFGLDAQYPQITEPLEDYLGLTHEQWPSKDLIEERIRTHLPALNNPKQALSFSRFKDIGSLQAKIADKNRGAPDAYGVQLWVNDPKIMWAVEELDSQQHSLRKEWKRSSRSVDFSMDSHMGRPKTHGYRAIHLEFECQASRGWKETMELQVIPTQMMATYLFTRAPYKTLTALEKIVKDEKGKNQNNWSNAERAVIYPLRDYIRALYEADTHETDLMGMLHHGVAPQSPNKQAALEKAEELQPVVENIVYAYLGSYKESPEEIFDNARDILPTDYTWPDEKKPKDITALEHD